MYTACFTGHRKIRESYYNTTNPTPEWAQMKNYLGQIVGAFIDNGVRTFISGMAIGVDTVAAEAVLGMIPVKGNVATLTAAIPFPSQPSRWIQAAKDNYYRILSQCHNQVVVSEDPYTPWKMHTRDRYMVDNSHYVIAVWDGRKGGGTYYTVNYAAEQKKTIFVVNPETCAGDWLAIPEGV